MSLSMPNGAAAPPRLFRTRNWLLIGMVFVVVMLLALIILPPLISARDDRVRAQFDDAQAFADALTITENDLQQMQSNVRGYLITRTPIFVEQYRATQDSLPANLQRLTELGPRVAEELEPQVAEVVNVIERWQRAGGDRQVALVDQGRLADAAAEVASGESQALFESFRTRIDDLRTQVQTTQSGLQAQLSRARALRFAVTTGLGVLGLLALGFVIVGFRRMLALTQAIDEERERTAALAGQVRAQLDATERRNQQLTLLNAVALASAQHMQREQRAQNVLAAITSALALPVGTIWIAHDRGGQLEPLARVPAPPHRHARSRGNGRAAERATIADQPSSAAGAAPAVITRVLSDGQPVILPETPGPDRLIELADLARDLGEPIRSAAVLPLYGRTHAIGVLLLAGELPDRFATDDMPFFATLASSVGLVLENALLFEEAETERQRLQTVFDHSPEGIIVVEAPANQIVLTNHAAVALFGPLPPGTPLHPHPLTGRVYRPGGEPCPAQELPLVAALREGIERRGVELIVEQPDGQRVPVLVTSIPLRDEDGVLRGAVAVFQDLRQLREVERLKSDFVALVSHELRTPLTTIKGCTETLLRGYGEADPARTREFLEIIDAQGERLQELIDNLLNLSQLEAGALRLRRELVNPQALIQGLLRQLRERLHDVRVQADLPSNLPLISADGRRLEQVLTNLLENARKFSPPGGVITVSAESTPKEVIIAVRDQGPGIPEAERERVFERFYQLEQSTTRNVGGTGLGLAICKALIEAHGGRIWIEGAPGGGAIVRFALAALPIETAASPVGGASVMTRQEVGATRVLVVDDDPALRRLLEGGLSDAGYRVQTVTEAQAALEAVVQQPPDIILLDLMLPGVDGFALSRQLREWTNVPIIMLTARAAERDIVLGLQLGADDYVTKPFGMNELIARMEAVLRRAQPEVAPGEVALIQIGDLAIDLAERRVTVEGAEVSLTPTEYRILTYLARHAGQVLTHEQILADVWGAEYGGESQYLWVHIAHLRQKIEPDSKNPRYILTERGVGYRLARE